RPGAGEDAGEIEDADVLEGTWHSSAGRVTVGLCPREAAGVVSPAGYLMPPERRSRWRPRCSSNPAGMSDRTWSENVWRRDPPGGAGAVCGVDRPAALT